MGLDRDGRFPWLEDEVHPAAKLVPHAVAVESRGVGIDPVPLLPVETGSKDHRTEPERNSEETLDREQRSQLFRVLGLVVGTQGDIDIDADHACEPSEQARRETSANVAAVAPSEEDAGACVDLEIRELLLRAFSDALLDLDARLFRERTTHDRQLGVAARAVTILADLAGGVLAAHQFHRIPGGSEAKLNARVGGHRTGEEPVRGIQARAVPVRSGVGIRAVTANGCDLGHGGDGLIPVLWQTDLYGPGAAEVLGDDFIALGVRAHTVPDAGNRMHDCPLFPRRTVLTHVAVRLDRSLGWRRLLILEHRRALWVLYHRIDVALVLVSILFALL